MWPEAVFHVSLALNIFWIFEYFAICSIGLISSVHFKASLKLIFPEQPNSVLFHTDCWERGLRGRVPTARRAPTRPLPATSTIPCDTLLGLPTHPGEGGLRKAQRCSGLFTGLVRRSPEPVQFYISGAPASHFSNTVQLGRQKRSSLSSSKKAEPISAVRGTFFSWQRLHRLSFKAI